MFDVYMIFITAFAVFGLYCLVESIVMYMCFRNSCETVTIIKYNGEYSTQNTIQYLNNTLYNNQVVVVSKEKIIFPQADAVSEEDLHKYITNALFTKN